MKTYAVVPSPRVDVVPGTWAPALPPSGLITPDTVVVDDDTGAPLLFTVAYPGALGMFRRAAQLMPMSTTYRAAGLRNESQVFGYVGRRAVLQREGCRLAASADQAPDAHAVLVDAAGLLAAQFTALHPVQAAADRALVTGAVLTDWLMPGSWWTSGVLNRTSALAYHTDRNNFATWSAMVVCRAGVDGGHLHLPELGITVACTDGAVIYFPGHRLLHGVTPFTRSRLDGYRFTAVYYSVSGMRHCAPSEAELDLARRARTAREDRIAEGISETHLRS